jgi:hypothetical protein
MICPVGNHENQEPELVRLAIQGLNAVNSEGSVMNVVGKASIVTHFLNSVSINGKVDHGF